MKKSYANMDPVEEIRAIRKEIMAEFKTLDALCEYLDSRRPAVTSEKVKNHKKTPTHRKTAKRLTHA